MRQQTVISRSQNRQYAVVLGSFSYDGYGDIPAFNASFPDTLTFDAETQRLSPVSPSSHLLERAERLLRGQLDPRTATITVTGSDDTYLQFRGTSTAMLNLPRIAATDVQRRHAGLAIIATGQVVGAERRDYGGDVIELDLTSLELRDVCANETLAVLPSPTSSAQASNDYGH